MTYQNSPSKSTKYIIAVIAVLIFAILFGFAMDGIITFVEKHVYKKPSEYAEYVDKYSEKYGVPEHVIYSVIKAESGFDPDAESAADAKGLMQMTPDTFEDLSLNHFEEINETSELFDPETNIRYGTYYLSYLYKRYGDWSVVYAAYNAGLGRVDGWLENSEYSSDGKTLKDIPFSETEKYVSRVERNVKMYDKIYEND